MPPDGRGNILCPAHGCCVAGCTSVLRVLELGLQPVETLVCAWVVAGNSAPFVPPCRWSRPFCRWFPYQTAPVWYQPRWWPECSGYRTHQGWLEHQALRSGRRSRLVAAVLSPGQMYEVEAAAPLLETLKNVLLVGDKGFDVDALRQQLQAQGCLACVPPRSGRRSPAWYHRGFYRQRHKIENFFQRIKIHKRISTRYEKLALTFLNFILVAAVIDWLKSV